MPKQVYNILIEQECIHLLKNNTVIYEVSINAKSINLAELYSKMEVDINDEYSLVDGLSKIETPKNDLERIFNNIHEFIEPLLISINKKLTELREKQSDDIFQS